MNKALYLHLQSFQLVSGAATVRYSLDVETNSINYVFSRLHPKDNYSKKIGRALVDARFVTGELRTIAIGEIIESLGANEILNEEGRNKLNVKDFTRSIVRSIIANRVQYDFHLGIGLSRSAFHAAKSAQVDAVDTPTPEAEAV